MRRKFAEEDRIVNLEAQVISARQTLAAANTLIGARRAQVNALELVIRTSKTDLDFMTLEAEAFCKEARELRKEVEVLRGMLQESVCANGLLTRTLGYCRAFAAVEDWRSVLIYLEEGA